MRLISAKVLDPTHLELLQPLEATTPGVVIQISLPSEPETDVDMWREAAKQQLLNAYADEDAVYDDL